MIDWKDLQLVHSVLCKVLGAAEFLIAVKLFFQDLDEWRLALFAFLLAEATSNLIPQNIRDPLWWRCVWMPLCLLRVGLAAVESCEIARFPLSRFPWGTDGERKRFLGYSVMGSGVLVLATWTWSPENRFQALDVANQYARLAVFCCFVLFWLWTYMTNGAYPAASLRVRKQARWWSLWLLTMFITSTKGKGGLLWHFFAWQGGYRYWLTVGIACMMVQAALLIEL